MLKRIFSLLLSTLTILSCHSQTEFYKHLEGKVGNSVNLVIDLVATGKNLGGYYYYFFDDNAGDESWTHYGKSMPVNGTISPSNVFEFSEFNTDIKGSTFKGEYKDGIMTGIWTSADGEKQIPFEAVETYPLGTMAFQVVYLNDQTTLTEQSNSPVAYLDLSLILPVDYPVANVADSVTAYIYDVFFEKAKPGSDPSILLDEARDLYFKNYKSSNEGIYEEGAASFNWKKIQEIRVLHNEQDILSVENFTYGYTGGAHGLSVSKFRVIDLKDGHQIRLDEIFRDDYRNDLRDILNSEARKKFNLERGQSLSDAGFFYEMIDPSDNFYMTKDGLGFYYNQYEVAPFAIGPVDIFISYGKLLRILKQDSMVNRLIKAG